MKNLKRKIAGLLSTLIISAILPTAVYASGKTAVTTGAVNFRDKASVQSEVMSLIPSGASLEILATEGNWVNVNYEGKTGWVSGKFVVDSDAVIISRTLTNVSETPLMASTEKKAETLAILKAGSVVTLLELEGEWYNVEFDGKTGYVKATGWVDAPSDTPVAPKEAVPTEGAFELFNDTVVYMNAMDARTAENAVGTYKAGEYQIFKNFSGMINITQYEGVPGAWIDPTGNLDVSLPVDELVEAVPDKSEQSVDESTENSFTVQVAGQVYQVTSLLETYLTAYEAASGTGAVGRFVPGNYYIFREFNGMLNLTKTKGVPGAWVNPSKMTGAPVEAPPAEEKDHPDTIVSSSSVNIRSGAGSTFQQIGYAKTGSKAVMTGIEGLWLKVEFEGTTGYTHKNYWNVSDELIAKFTKPQDHPDTIVSNSSVNLREGAGNSFPVMRNITSGAKAVLTGKEGSWLRIDYNGQIGYSFINYWDVPESVLARYEKQVEVPSANGFKVYLDPGHMGEGKGAVGIHNGKKYDENNINYRVAILTKDILEKRGYTVYISKKHSEDPVDLLERSLEANALGADIFVSIHTNSFSNSSANGTIGFWAGQKNNPTTSDWEIKSRLLAQLLAKSVGNVIGTYKAVSDLSYGISYSINRNSNMPSTLLELGFISNYHDAVIMDDSASQKQMAREIADGIDEYFGN